MMNESQTAVLPALLIAITGVLVDATFRSDAYQDRIWAQIALWLAASLQGTLDDDATLSIISTILIHGTFCLSLVSATYEAFVVQCRWNTSETIRAYYSRFLAPSMILPLIYSWIYFSSADDLHSAWSQCMALYCVALLSLCGWRWTALRKRRVRQDLVGMPTVESMPVFSTSTRSLEKRLWMKWTPSEVLNWIHSFEGDEWYSVCSQLAPERIPGCVLDTLTVAELRSMGLPFGLSQSLMDKIHDLKTEYPSPRARSERNRDPQQHELEIDEWIQSDLSSMETSQKWTRAPTVDGYQEQLANGGDLSHETDMAILGELNEEAIQRAKDVFREQFGLELPEIKLRPAVQQPLMNVDAGRYVEDAPATLSEPAVLVRASSAEGPGSQGANDVPQDLLDTMPPHVREVAEQQPDIVQMLWKQREGKSASSFGLSRIHQLRMQDPAYAKRFLGAQAAAEMTGIPLAGDSYQTGHAEEDDGQDQNCDGERTGLLRKRAARPPTYSATR